MTTEEIKRIVDDERAEQLTAQMCHHWQVATNRLEELSQELDADMDTCIEADVYAIMMHMQRAVMLLVDLNKMPCVYLFSEYLDRINLAISDTSVRRSVMKLLNRLLVGYSAEHKEDIMDLLARQMELPEETQKAIEQKVSPLQHMLSACAQYMKPEDLMMVVNTIQAISAEGSTADHKQIADYLKIVRQDMTVLSEKMASSLQVMLMGLLVLMLLPEMLMNMVKQGRTNSKTMAQLFNKVLARVRESNEWYEYWKNYRDTLRVVCDSNSWSDIMTQERSKERAELGKIPGGLFAKWTTDRTAFDEEFLDVRLSDDDLRRFIFHLASLYEIARELDPTTKYGDEQLVNNHIHQVGDAVLEAAHKLDDLVADRWFPYYDKMWQELISNEIIFAHLKVTRKSPHNHQFTARFFCHLVGEMKKSAIFGAHSDNDLAEKLTDKSSVGTFRKNIQEKMDEEGENIRNVFDAIFLKYNNLLSGKQ